MRKGRKESKNGRSKERNIDTVIETVTDTVIETDTVFDTDIVTGRHGNRNRQKQVRSHN